MVQIVILFPLHIACNFEGYAAHRTPPISAARSSSSRRHLARSSTVHVESSDTMHSRKAQCLAPPHNPETGDAYHSRGRSCACEKIKHQKNVYKRHSSSAKTYLYKRGRLPQTRNLWKKRESMGSRVGRVSSHAVSRWSRSPGCCGFRGVFVVRWDFVVFFFEHTRPAASSIRPPRLIYLSTST